MKTFSRLAALVLFCFTTSVFAADAFEGKVTLGMKDRKDKEVVISYVMKGSKIRMIPDVQEAQGVALIFDVEKGEMMTLMPEQKMYMVMSMKGAMNSAAKKSSKEKMPELVKTGRTETILGYKCDEYVMTDERGNKTEIWATDKLGTYMGASAGGGGMMGRGKASGPAWENVLKGRDGFFPLRVVSRDRKDKETFRMEAKSVEPGNVPDSTFEPPAGFQKFALPNLGGLFGK